MPTVLLALLAAIAFAGGWFVTGVLRGRTARHEDGDRLAEEYFTESSGPDGGSS